MKSRKTIKGEKHHWWPKALSKYWLNEKGLVHRIDHFGNIITSTSKEFGHISDGHNIIFSKEGLWNSTVEHFFDNPDNNFPKIVEWLMTHKGKNENSDDLFMALDDEDPHLDILRECILSLIVRSPKYRGSIQLLVESMRGTLDKSELKNLISLNINQKYNTLLNNSKQKGKFALLFSNKNEFIFGDGFYSTVNASTDTIYNFKTVVPLTPNLAVIWSCPTSTPTNPRLVSIPADDSIVDLINQSIQVYAKEYLFFRRQQPILIEAFKCDQHRVYDFSCDPISQLINSLIPDTSSNRLFW